MMINIEKFTKSVKNTRFDSKRITNKAERKLQKEFRQSRQSGFKRLVISDEAIYN